MGASESTRALVTKVAAVGAGLRDVVKKNAKKKKGVLPSFLLCFVTKINFITKQKQKKKLLRFFEKLENQKWL